MINPYDLSNNFNIQTGPAVPIINPAAQTAGSTSTQLPGTSAAPASPFTYSGTPAPAANPNQSVSDLLAGLYGTPKIQTNAPIVAPAGPVAPGITYGKPLEAFPPKDNPVGGFNADGTPKYNTGPVTTPVVPPGTPAPTYTHSLSAQDLLDQGLLNPAALPEPDPAKVYQSQLQQVQTQIDSTNNLYNDLIAQARARLAPVEAARTQQGFLGNVRSGSIGSGFDTGVNDRINTANQNEVSASDAEINSRRQQALNDIYGQARTASAAELSYQREQKSKNADAILGEINTRPQRKAAALSPVILDMLSKGVNPNEMTPEALKDLATSFGKLNVSTEDIVSSYKTQVAAQKKAEADAAKEAATTANIGKPASAQEYEYAKKNGYTGTYTQYQTEDANRKAAAAKTPSAGDKETATISEYSAGLVPGKLIPGSGGVPFVDNNNFLTPQGFHAAVSAAQQDGLPRAKFLENFASLLSPTQLSAYGLTPKEIKDITGALPTQ